MTSNFCLSSPGLMQEIEDLKALTNGNPPVNPEEYSQILQRLANAYRALEDLVANSVPPVDSQAVEAMLESLDTASQNLMNQIENQVQNQPEMAGVASGIADLSRGMSELGAALASSSDPDLSVLSPNSGLEADLEALAIEAAGKGY